MELNDKKKKDEAFRRAFQAKKFKGSRYNYGKVGHHSIDCCKPKKQAQANIIDSDAISNGILDINLSTIIS